MSELCCWSCGQAIVVGGQPVIGSGVVHDYIERHKLDGSIEYVGVSVRAYCPQHPVEAQCLAQSSEAVEIAMAEARCE